MIEHTYAHLVTPVIFDRYFSLRYFCFDCLAAILALNLVRPPNGGVPQGLLCRFRSFGGAGFEDQPAQRSISSTDRPIKSPAQTQGCKHV
jgi:hypothetical protein